MGCARGKPDSKSRKVKTLWWSPSVEFVCHRYRLFEIFWALLLLLLLLLLILNFSYAHMPYTHFFQFICMCVSTVHEHPFNNRNNNNNCSEKSSREWKKQQRYLPALNDPLSLWVFLQCLLTAVSNSDQSKTRNTCIQMYMLAYTRFTYFASEFCVDFR